MTYSPVGERIGLSLHNQRFGLSNRQKVEKSAQAPIVRCWRFYLAHQFYGGRCAEAARPAGYRSFPIRF
ncbi:hypothetical protein XAC3810_960001 [Xanthomonas citri pv. citri]|uniref:Uncharacterized protein n=1 Tax=Xanthomonas citri pv. citri TaxID=611301 RepID=A0A0U5FAD8_XANCI|nr:hypothetical protein XAC3810_960001 [Xanthomonas citri pv. citri]CEE55293.1 hypothetical protein XACW160_1450001 [Xanthomonas citri pv. citri]CEF34407.1 hypothetical protein XAC40_p110003 [Xanthomonas citri pv. citri]CEG15234.1 hypothetical protein XAC3562_1780001 [Xanthomonas citri pv. citri]